ncbi:MAG: hypothetical protein ACXAC5_01970 [Promethearchaeota archaeon]
MTRHRPKMKRLQTKKHGTCAAINCGVQANGQQFLYVCTECKKPFCSAHIVGSERKCESCCQRAGVL